MEDNNKPQSYLDEKKILLENGAINERMFIAFKEAHERSEKNRMYLEQKFQEYLQQKAKCTEEELKKYNDNFQNNLKSLNDDDLGIVIARVPAHYASMSLNEIEALLPPSVFKRMVKKIQPNTDPKKWLSFPEREKRKGLVSLAVFIDTLIRRFEITALDKHVRKASGTSELREEMERCLHLYPKEDEIEQYTQELVRSKKMPYPYNIYGILKRRPDKKRPQTVLKHVEGYGDIIIYGGKDELKQRSLFYHGDSFFGGHISKEMDELSKYYENIKEAPKGFQKDSRAGVGFFATSEQTKKSQLIYDDAKTSLAMIEAAEKIAMASKYDYTEAHILGGLSLPDDIEEIYVNASIEKDFKSIFEDDKNKKWLSEKGITSEVFYPILKKTNYMSY